MKIWLGIIASLFAAARVTVSAVYYIDPAEGDDSNSGVRGSPWRGFAPLEKITLSAGDRVEIARAGELRDTLALTGTGSAQMPVVVRFAPGRYDWFPEKLLARKLAISNANDDPNGEKAIAMELKNLAWVRIEGEGAVFFCRGKMMQVHLENARDIVLSGFGFDYQRPTVSECKVESLSASDAVLAVHSDSTYVVENGKVVWVGEGWRTEADNYWQVFDPRHNAVRRCRSPLGGADVEEIAPGKLRVRFEKNPGFADGQVYQQRDVRRDYASVFCERSERIEWRGVKFYFMHGMGVVSQFSRDLSFHNVEIAPRAESGRTCAAWADMLHFSGCGGKITVDGARFFGANDDAINIHGTHLRIVETAATGRVKARFMHPQTFGFPAFADGDRVAFVNSKTLRPYAETTVSEAKMLGDREMALTLSDPLPDNIAADDVLENVTWTPSAEIKNCTVEAIPTRGFLLTMRQPVLIANNIFRRTQMSAILVADDARSWYESGPVRDLTISGNTFDHCGEPVLNFHPENHPADNDLPVHKNITISGNKFLLTGTRALFLKSTAEVTVADNHFIPDKKSDTLKVENLIQYQASPPASLRRNLCKETAEDTERAKKNAPSFP